MNILANVKLALKRRASLQKEIDAIDRMFAGFGSVKVGRGPGRPPGSGKGRRHMSAAAKAKLSAVAKARWKKAKAAGKARL